MIGNFIGQRDSKKQASVIHRQEKSQAEYQQKEKTLNLDENQGYVINYKLNCLNNQS
jgi:hypothetical protein